MTETLSCTLFERLEQFPIFIRIEPFQLETQLNKLYNPLKRRTLSELHGITTKETTAFIVTAM
jgi:hypothetical protein